MAGKDGELARVREAEEQAQVRLAALSSTITQHASVIAEKERELVGLREAVNAMKRDGESERQAMQGQMQQHASVITVKEVELLRLQGKIQQQSMEQQQLCWSGEAFREVER